MATWDFKSAFIYDRDGGSGNFSNKAGETDIDGSLTDSNANTTFEIGETITAAPGGYTGTFQGTIVIGGETFVVVTNGADTDTAYLFSDLDLAAADAILPHTINESELNDSGSFLVCFAQGTLIAVPDGERPAETLKIGDLVVTSGGQAVRVKWVGHQTVSTVFSPAERLMQVRFAAGCLGNGLPHADLTVTADHAMLVDGVLCHAGALVNGISVTRVPLSEMGETFTVYHIETEEHAIILANGASAETFIDNVSRRVFDNYSEFEAIYGDVPEMEELPYPRAMSARQVPTHIKAKLGVADAA